MRYAFVILLCLLCSFSCFAQNVTTLISGQTLTAGTILSTVPSAGGGGGSSNNIASYATSTGRNENLWAGVQFVSPATNITVTALGINLVGTTITAHPIVLVNASTTLASNTIPAGASGFYTVPVSATITASSTVSIAYYEDDIASHDYWYDAADVTLSGGATSAISCYQVPGSVTKNSDLITVTSGKGYAAVTLIYQ